MRPQQAFPSQVFVQLGNLQAVGTDQHTNARTHDRKRKQARTRTPAGTSAHPEHGAVASMLLHYKTHVRPRPQHTHIRETKHLTHAHFLTNLERLGAIVDPCLHRRSDAAPPAPACSSAGCNAGHILCDMRLQTRHYKASMPATGGKLHAETHQGVPTHALTRLVSGGCASPDKLGLVLPHTKIRGTTLASKT